MESLSEILQFLKIDQRLDLKAVSMSHVLGLTGSQEGKVLLLDSPEMIQAIIKLTLDKTITIAKDAVLSLVNLTAEEDGAIKVFEAAAEDIHTKCFVLMGVASIIDKDSELADPWTMVLCNITRVEYLVDKVLEEFEKGERCLLRLVKAFMHVKFNEKNATLHYLGPMFCNLTQSARGRAIFCDPKNNFFQRITHFTNFEGSIIRQGGTIGTLKNICFDPVYHGVVLDEKDDALYCLLYPLAGPEEFTEEENEKFPVELQYLHICGDRKTRVSDPDLRKMLLESLLQLCATKKCREFLRSKGAYEFLREYHKWEASIGEDREALLVCEKVVDILIRTEEEIGIDNLKDIEVPGHLIKKFVEDDHNYVSEK